MGWLGGEPVPLLLSKIHGEQGRRAAGVDEGDVLLPVEVALLHQHQEFGPSLAGVNGVQQDPLLSGQFLDVGQVT